MFDCIIIGSGFGGSVLACRLAEKGLKVLVLERGRRWGMKPGESKFPRAPDDPWLWNERKPEKQNGWLDLRLFRNMAVAQGAAVGGGSHIYANVSVEARPDIFKQGWPEEITYGELKPYYDQVGRMMRSQVLPESQATKRYNLMREGAQAIGQGSRFKPLTLAVNFDPGFNPDAPGAREARHSKKFVNEQGVEQGTCIHCGNCDVGCEVGAKNTLDLNYLAWAEKKGAEVRPLHLVKAIVPEDSGYRVEFDRLENGERIPGFEKAARVILAAGSLGSTELLLRCKQQFKTLPNISPRLGINWSSNGDFLTPAFYENRKVSPNHGPTITCAIDFLDGSAGPKGEQFWIEDGGIPDLLGAYLNRAAHQGFFRNLLSQHRFAQRALRQFIASDDPMENMMPWFAQGVDAADGKLYLGRDWWGLHPWNQILKLNWDIQKSKGVIDAIVAMHKKLSKATGGEPNVPKTWKYLKDLVTPHPLGGCNMGYNSETGVVSHRGEVFGYPGLYVADGAIVPEAVGVNPSRTIAALAERIAVQMQ